MTYIPSKEILERYASVLIDFALGGGSGVQPGEGGRVAAPESAKPLYAELRKAIWRAGGRVIGAYEPDDARRTIYRIDVFDSAKEVQLVYFPAKYMRGLIDEM